MNVKNVIFWGIVGLLLGLICGIAFAETTVIETGLGDKPIIYKETSIEFNMGKCRETKTDEQCMTEFVNIIRADANADMECLYY